MPNVFGFVVVIIGLENSAISLKVFGPGGSTQKKTRIFTLRDALQRLKEVSSGLIYSAEKWLTSLNASTLKVK